MGDRNRVSLSPSLPLPSLVDYRFSSSWVCVSFTHARIDTNRGSVCESARDMQRRAFREEKQQPASVVRPCVRSAGVSMSNRGRERESIYSLSRENERKTFALCNNKRQRREEREENSDLDPFTRAAPATIREERTHVPADKKKTSSVD